MSRQIIIGAIFIVLGIIYIIKPNIFRRWFWKRTSTAQQTMSGKNYILYMRISGAILIALGLMFVLNHNT